MRPEDVRSLEDLGRLTADVLRGHSDAHLPNGDVDMEETGPIVEDLANFCERGFVTTCSQPAYPSDGTGGSRAFVTGFCSESLADRIQEATIGTDLVAVLHPPGQDHWATIMVGTPPGPEDPALCLGRTQPSWDRDQFSRRVTSAAGEAVWNAWYVEIFDPKWGRVDLLWSTLRSALGG